MEISQRPRKISFPADCVLNAVIQDGDTYELLQIVKNRRGEVNLEQRSHVGLTALHHAVLSGNLDAVKILLANGVTVNTQDVSGFSPLHTASACGFLQIVSLLVLFGADVFSLTNMAELPIDVAKDLSVLRLLHDDMCQQIHSEVYVTSLVTAKLWQLWTAVQKLMILVCEMCYYLLNDLRRRRRTMVDNIPPVVGKDVNVCEEESAMQTAMAHTYNVKQNKID
jgi:hypothetical protein